MNKGIYQAFIHGGENRVNKCCVREERAGQRMMMSSDAPYLSAGVIVSSKGNSEVDYLNPALLCECILLSS